MIRLFSFLFCIVFFSPSLCAQQRYICPGAIWPDNQGTHINAHGGGVLFHKGKYYWYGEFKSEHTSSALVGVTCYSSKDLVNWHNEGIALPVVDDPQSDITRGCILERPKVIYNSKTKKFVMWFHLELKDKGYAAARAGVAISDTPTGPFRFVKSYRPNAGRYPMNMSESERAMMDTIQVGHFKKWWTPDWYKAIDKGLLVQRDKEGGQMARDMTLYVDDDGKAYHIFSSEENLTLQIAELSDDYLSHTGNFVRVAPAGHNEAPALFKHKGTYWMITSGCTGWAPNKARMFHAKSILGPWLQDDNPCIGKDADLTFHSQSTFILPVQGMKDAFIFMADRWKPNTPQDARYIWLPIRFDEFDTPFLQWIPAWKPMERESYSNGNKKSWELVWADEFNQDGALDSDKWVYEEGLVRNKEWQWYQSENAYCKNGKLILEARHEERPNPLYNASENDWKSSRKMVTCTSASVQTRGKFDFLYGRLEVRAKIPTACGAWPAIWTLGKERSWPANGELDLMEYYRINDVPHILANGAWLSLNEKQTQWDSRSVPFSHFLLNDPAWADKFHVWTMDWEPNYIRMYLDGELLNVINIEESKGKDGFYPFRQPHYILLDLAIGENGGDADWSKFPLRYEIDFVRVYKTK